MGLLDKLEKAADTVVHKGPAEAGALVHHLPEIQGRIPGVPHVPGVPHDNGTSHSSKHHKADHVDMPPAPYPLKQIDHGHAKR